MFVRAMKKYNIWVNPCAIYDKLKLGYLAITLDITTIEKPELKITKGPRSKKILLQELNPRITMLVHCSYHYAADTTCPER